jgi:hypothetical protein
VRIVKFLLVALLVSFPVFMGLSISADAFGLPDTDTWILVIRLVGTAVSALVAWMIVGKHTAMTVFMTVMPVIGLISNLIYLGCFLFGVAAVVMLFAKDAQWLYEHLYRAYVTPSAALAVFSLIPMSILLMLFRKTRALGGLSLYLLSIFVGFTLWLYSLIVAGSHGAGWVIGGLCMAGLGVYVTAMISSAIFGEWGIAGNILLVVILVAVARVFGWSIAEKQFEKDDETERAAQPAEPVEPSVSG